MFFSILWDFSFVWVFQRPEFFDILFQLATICFYMHHFSIDALQNIVQWDWTVFFVYPMSIIAHLRAFLPTGLMKLCHVMRDEYAILQVVLSTGNLRMRTCNNFTRHANYWCLYAAHLHAWWSNRFAFLKWWMRAIFIN